MTKQYLKTLNEIEQNINKGKKVYWRFDNTTLKKQKNSNSIVVNIPKNHEKYVSFYIDNVVKKFGVTDFYCYN